MQSPRELKDRGPKNPEIVFIPVVTGRSGLCGTIRTAIFNDCGHVL